ncbi:GNAT family N-acetyltransferase [Microbacterium sp. cx-55]|uniref:GNAT family N-acetyltransferase n=1 Tax=unclassified Microbacterium TaxID=2609290 RepID=UPI001CBBA4B7|nr:MULTISPECIES: GNAT family N-acetyltransferase [unclassified Microbacterium]MBZ4486534.1 GNAT family N-acetyltransferase [Microbacterium sp. cx-55]MCC4907507.1 GNAT family N-acetyltransferase [Microbacterium sp. cx-59]UGB36498.1 GNAT family N-acetyltransferase [Microbacterium sp. cx-55]
MVTIRPLTTSDRHDWLALWSGYLAFYETALDDATTDATFARLVDSESSMHAALARDENDTVIGLVQWVTHPATWSTGDYCYLEDLFVSPDARGGGTGRALIEHVRAWAADERCAKVYWLTAESNSVARELYDRVATRSGMIQYQIRL